MRSSISDREEAMEKKFQHDNELQFKIKARRNRMLGYWAGELLGMTGADLEGYAARIVNHTIRYPSDASLIDKIFEEFEENNIAFTKHQIEKQLQYFAQDANKEFQTGIAV